MAFRCFRKRQGESHVDFKARVMEGFRSWPSGHVVLAPRVNWPEVAIVATSEGERALNVATGYEARWGYMM